MNPVRYICNWPFGDFMMIHESAEECCRVLKTKKGHLYSDVQLEIVAKLCGGNKVAA